MKGAMFRPWGYAGPLRVLGFVLTVAVLLGAVFWYAGYVRSAMGSLEDSPPAATQRARK